VSTRTGAAVLTVLVLTSLAGCSDEPPRPDAAPRDADTDTDSPDADSDVPSVLPCDIVEENHCGDDARCTTYSADGISWHPGCLPFPTTEPAETGARCSFSRDENGLRVHDCAHGSHCMNVRAEGGLRCMRLCSFENAFACQWAYPVEDGIAHTGICARSPLLPRGLVTNYLCHIPDDCDPRCNDCDSQYDTCIFLSGINRSGWTCHAHIPARSGDGQRGDSCQSPWECRSPQVCISDRCQQTCFSEEGADGDADADADGDADADADADEDRDSGPPPPRECTRLECPEASDICDTDGIYWWIYANPDIGICEGKP
jgi:hypothetical protein